MTVQQRRTARLEMEAQRALAARLLAEMENPTPLKPAVAAKAAAFDAETTRNGWGREDEDAHEPKRAYSWSDVITYEDPDENGHVIWTGPTTLLGPTQQPTPKQYGIHALCGKSHFQAARWAKEEQLGTALDQTFETVNRTCDEALCVAPAHHVVKERA